jgi:expansin (peptidoglycan-binding protein)
VTPGAGSGAGGAGMSGSPAAGMPAAGAGTGGMAAVPQAGASGGAGSSGSQSTPPAPDAGTDANVSPPPEMDSAGGGDRCRNDASVHQGQATWYQLATPLVNCSYPTATLPMFYGAMNTHDYAAAATCGTCVRVQGPQGTVEIQIVDQCPVATNPICTAGHIDLNVPAFEQIADRVAGVVPITWTYIPCSVQGNLRYEFKEGSSQYWTALLVRNARYELERVEYRTANGSWKELQRADYNYWLDEQGMGPGPYTLRITDVYGHYVVDAGVPLQVGGVIEGSGQFAACN